jgi:predicted component of type VI protein secretion system
MEVRLKVLVGANAGQELKIPAPKFFVGRAEDCQLRPRSDLISRHHCVFLIEEGFVSLRDFGSKNGTIVNGERVSNEIELKSGDQVTIGPLQFEVIVTATVAGKKRPPVESMKEAASRTVQGAAGDVDVSRWLEPGEIGPATNETMVADTHTLNMNETSHSLDVGRADDTVAGIPTIKGDERPSGSERKIPDKNAVPGKLPPVPKGTTGDSRAAASDVLNKFFKRR